MSRAASIEHLDAVEKKLRSAQGVLFPVTESVTAHILEIERLTNTLELGISAASIYVQVSVLVGDRVVLMCPWTRQTLDTLPVTCSAEDILSVLRQALAAFY